MRSDLQPAPARSASYPPRPGNRVSVLIDGETALGRIFTVAAAAVRSLWITVSFVNLELLIPGTQTTLLAFVSELANRGIDVRLLFWWSEYSGIGSFRGEEEELARLSRNDVRVRMRWDQVPRGCHHQKSHIVDGRMAFVGGINLTSDGVSSAEHRDGVGYHDMFAEIEGPVVADVAANFVQRWNQATRTLRYGHAFPSLAEAAQIPETRVSAPAPVAREGAKAQVVRTIRRGLYEGTAGWNQRHCFELAEGEQSIREVTLAWIQGAERRIYIENQYLTDPQTIRGLSAAARRGVEVIAVVPLEPDANLLLYPEEQMRKTRAALAELAGLHGFGLFGLIQSGEVERPIYVHAKLMIIDDRALMLGSANLWPPSYSRDSELNICVWDAALATHTREQLWLEHLGDAAVTELAEWCEAATTAGTPRRSRVVAIDPAAYYDFADGAVAPWADVEPET